MHILVFRKKMTHFSTDLLIDTLVLGFLRDEKMLPVLTF